MLRSLLIWLLLALAMGLVQWPYQALSDLGFQLQRRLWPRQGLDAAGPPGGPLWSGMLLMFLASAALLRLAWGPLAAGRGGV
jgi:hypothetical protein